MVDSMLQVRARDCASAGSRIIKHGQANHAPCLPACHRYQPRWQLAHRGVAPPRYGHADTTPASSAPLQLSNVEVITSYLFGSKDGAKALPVAKALEEDLAGGWGWQQPGQGSGRCLEPSPTIRAAHAVPLLLPWVTCRPWRRATQQGATAQVASLLFVWPLWPAWQGDGIKMLLPAVRAPPQATPMPASRAWSRSTRPGWPPTASASWQTTGARWACSAHAGPALCMPPPPAARTLICLPRRRSRLAWASHPRTLPYSPASHRRFARRPPCSTFAEQRAAALGQTLEGVLNTELEGLESDAEARRCGARPGGQPVPSQAGAPGSCRGETHPGPLPCSSRRCPHWGAASPYPHLLGAYPISWRLCTPTAGGGARCGNSPLRQRRRLPRAARRLIQRRRWWLWRPSTPRPPVRGRAGPSAAWRPPAAAPQAVFAGSCAASPYLRSTQGSGEIRLVQPCCGGERGRQIFDTCLAAGLRCTAGGLCLLTSPPSPCARLFHAAEVMLEEEVREAVISTAGTAAGEAPPAAAPRATRPRAGSVPPLRAPPPPFSVPCHAPRRAAL